MDAGDGSRLRCTDLAVHIGGVKALDGVGLELRAGEVLGLIGPNGAGKTTLLNVLSGYVAATAGQVFLDGREIVGTRPDALARRGLVRTFQGARLFGDLSVLQNAEVAALAHGTRRSAARAEAGRALALVGLEDRADTPAAALSCGAQRQAAIARAVAMRPRYLLLDEPAAGLNEEEGRELAATIAKLRDSGVGVLLVEHDMAVAMGVSNRVHVLDSGRTICEGTPAQVQTDPTVIAAYLGAGHRA